jgi:Dyp-type peroxidase family
MGTLDRNDIQGLVLFGHARLPHSRHVLLQLGERGAAQRWLRGLAEQVTTGRELPREQRQEWALQVAFTARGLERLGLRRGTRGELELDTFPREFVEGMADPHRARRLGDIGDSAPQHWQFSDRRTEGDQEVHVLLMLYAVEVERLEALHTRQRERYTAAGVRELLCQQSALRRLPGTGPEDERYKEPFGYVDGMTKVAIAGTTTPGKHVVEVPPGEVLLGHRNIYHQLPSSPTVPAELDPQDLLADSPAAQGRKDLGRNGTYLVLRKLRQDVQAFESFLQEQAHLLAREPGVEDPKELLAAKLMGRWRSGAPLVSCPLKDDPALAKDVEKANDFLYAQDAHGLKCPVSSHIRRSNPRDSLALGDPEALKLADHHLIIRRGRPYAEPPRSPGAEPEQGMLFIALNANLSRQFEFIQQTWINNPKFNGLRNSNDPLLGGSRQGEGDEEGLGDEVDIPARPFRYRAKGLARFVHTRGGGYFFLPGLRALRFLATFKP